jgi:hypothetical protein
VTDQSLIHAVADLPRLDRWSVCLRLQELGIASHCTEDGSLQVAIDNTLQALLLRSVIFRFFASKQTSIDWLDRCWAL